MPTWNLLKSSDRPYRSHLHELFEWPDFGKEIRRCNTNYNTFHINFTLLQVSIDSKTDSFRRFSAFDLPVWIPGRPGVRNKAQQGESRGWKYPALWERPDWDARRSTDSGINRRREKTTYYYETIVASRHTILQQRRRILRRVSQIMICCDCELIDFGMPVVYIFFAARVQLWHKLANIFVV